MRYSKLVSEVYVVGRIWQGVQCAYTYSLSAYDIANIRSMVGVRHITTMREAVEDWLGTAAGDFQSIQDFRVTISTLDGFDFDSDWATEAGEILWCDCTSEEDE